MYNEKKELEKAHALLQDVHDLLQEQDDNTEREEPCLLDAIRFWLENYEHSKKKNDEVKINACDNEAITMEETDLDENGFYPMELGNLLFGNSRGEYPLQPRKEFDDIYVEEILDKTDIDGCGSVPKMMWNDEVRGYDCDLFTISPYYWGDDEEEAEKPNFIYKPTGLEIQWYKYPFRDSYSNKKITPKELRIILRECAERYIENCKKKEDASDGK